MKVVTEPDKPTAAKCPMGKENKAHGSSRPGHWQKEMWPKQEEMWLKQEGGVTWWTCYLLKTMHHRIISKLGVKIMHHYDEDMKSSKQTIYQ
jgi:hypothetical protein